MADHIPERLFTKRPHDKYVYGINWQEKTLPEHLPLLSSVWEVQTGLVVHEPGPDGAVIPTPDTQITVDRVVNGVVSQVVIDVYSGQINSPDNDKTTIWISGGVKNGGKDGYLAINHVTLANGIVTDAPLRIKII
jgi:hypothetical protein